MSEPTWRHTWCEGGVLAEVRVWRSGGVVVAVQGVARGVGANGQLSGAELPLARIGEEGGELECLVSEGDPLVAVFGRTSAPGEPLVDVFAASAAEASDHEPRVPRGHVVVGLAAAVGGAGVVGLRALYDREEDRQTAACGARVQAEVSTTAAARWRRHTVQELAAARDRGERLWAHWPAEERRDLPCTLTFTVPAEVSASRLYLRLFRVSGVSVHAQAADQELAVAPLDWGDEEPLCWLDVAPLGAGTHKVVLRAEGGWAMLLWAELVGAR